MDTVDDELWFEIRDRADVLRLEPLGYAYPNSDSDFDRHWVKTKVNVVGGAFSGEYIAELLTEDYEIIKSGLSALYENLKGKAVFANIDGSLKVEIEGDGLGHFEANVSACDRPCLGAELNFILSFDQTSIKPMIKQLNDITRRFPVLGRDFSIYRRKF
jgi:hypothetical protein